MRTSGILTIGGAFVAILGSAFALLMLRAFFVDKGQGFVDLSGLVVGGVVAVVGLGLVAAGRKRARMEHEHDDLHFSEMALALAKKNGGQVQVEQVVKASGLTRDEATSRMRQLTGRGLFDLDFDANGQMVWSSAPSSPRLPAGADDPLPRRLAHRAGGAGRVHGWSVSLMRWAAFALLAVACAHSRQSRLSPHPAAEGAAEDGDSGEVQPRASPRAYRHYLDAHLANNADDFATAASELREALLYDPESPHLHCVLAEVLIKQGRLNDAEEELQTALALDPKHAPARLLSARIAVARGNLPEAREHFQIAIEGQPDDPEAYHDLVRLPLATVDAPAAEAVAERLAIRLRGAQERPGDDVLGLVTVDRLREQSAWVWVELGRWWSQHGDDDAARRAFARARSASPSDPDALAAEAAWLETKRRFADARERYLRLLSQRPEALEVLAALAPRGAGKAA